MNRKPFYRLLLLVSCCYSPFVLTVESVTPALTLAKTYQQGIDVSQYWVSEKLDGVRAYWNGRQLISRQGHVLNAPDWFMTDFPKQVLDGELWLGRNTFQQLMTLINTQQSNEQWRQVRYFVFDMPDVKRPFDSRLKQLQQSVGASSNPYLKIVHQYRISDEQALQDELQRVVKAGGEGLMLHKGSALYHSGRNDDLLKVKPYFDAEAIVIAHLPGKGKFKGLLGSLQVQMENGQQFRIGTGFSDEQRRNPPAIGSIITYTYHGLTDRGIPRFASFLRVREEN